MVRPLPIPADVAPGAYFIGAVADAGNAVVELDEGNNTGVTATPVMITLFLFFFNDTATTEIYTLSLHDALPISNTVSNHGTPGATAGPFRIDFYLSTDNVIRRGEVWLPGKLRAAMPASGWR